MGIPPGPIYRQILENIEDAQLEGRITTSEDAIKMAKQLLENGNLLISLA
jgi:poly(A) polymerase